MQAMRRVLGVQSSSDFHDHGLQLLVPDPTNKEELQVKRTVDIVFVHGLTGTWDGTWTGEIPDGRKVLWPKELLKERFPAARISSFSYDANAVNLVHRVSTQSITQHANDLLIELETLRRETSTQGYKIVFAVHSLGGLVVQKMLALSKNSHEAHYQGIESLTVGAAFFGTPMLGADLAAWASIGTALSSILKQTNRDIVGILEPNSSMAESIRLDITNLVATRSHTGNLLRIACFYECLPVPGYGKVVVNDKSATWPPHYQKGIQADHMSMTKFASTQKRGYRDFIGEVGRWIDEDTGERRQPSEILDDLDFAERTARQQQIDNANALESTLDWIWSEEFETRSSFAQWLLNDQAVFWIQGKPGSGKSTLMSYLERASRSWKMHSKSDSHWSTIRFFFDFRAHGGLANNFEGLLRSLLFQILKQNPSSEDEVHCLEEKFGNYKPGTWTSSALKEAFVNALGKTSVNMCILVDGLDEFSGDMQELLTFLHGMPSKTSTGHLVKICLASRPLPVIALALEDRPGLQMQAHNNNAIEQYAFTTMTNLRVAAHDKPLLQRFSAHLAKKAEGVFLWARFAVKEIVNGYAEGDNIGELNQRLEELPSDMEELYAHIFRRMNSRDHEEVRSMFQLVCFAESFEHIDRHLNCINLRQLKEAVAILQNGTAEAGQHDSVEDLERFRKRLKAKSGGLLEEIYDHRDVKADKTFDGKYSDSDIEVEMGSQYSDGFSDDFAEMFQEHFNKNGGIVKLIHRTAESYLNRKGWLLGLKSPHFKSPHALWLYVCCRSIQSELGPRELQLRNAKVKKLDFDESTKFSLFHYAATNLFNHARLMEYKYKESPLSLLETIPPTLWRFLRKQYRPQLNWKMRGDGYILDWNAIDERSDIQPWQIIVEQGLPLCLKDAALKNHYTPPRDGEDISIVLTMVPEYFQMRAQKGHYYDSLHEQRAVMGLLAFLLKSGVEITEWNIFISILIGKAETLEMLLDLWPRGNIRLGKHMSYLSRSSKRSNDAKNGKYNGESVGILYELVRATQSRFFEEYDFEAKLVLLLRRGEVLNKICGPVGTALHASVIRPRLFSADWDSAEPMRVILDHGADPNISGPWGTPLQLAWRTFRSLSVYDLKEPRYFCSQNIMTLLLDYGADASWVEPNGMSIDRRTIEAWCAMSEEELIARWNDDDYPYCKSTWDTYEFPLYHTRKDLEIDASKDTRSPPRKRRRLPLEENEDDDAVS